MSEEGIHNARQLYRQLEPSSELLARIEARLPTAIQTEKSSTRSFRTTPVPRRRRTARNLQWSMAAVIVGTSAWATWRQFATNSTEPKLAESRSAPTSPPQRLQPNPTIPLSTVPVLAAKPSQPAFDTEPAAQFFELKPQTPRKGMGTLTNHCLGTWDEYTEFPGSGLSATKALDYLYGSYSCSLQWFDSPTEEDILTLSINRAPRPIVGCETARGIRVPLEVSAAFLAENHTSQGTGTVLVHDLSVFSLSFRIRENNNFTFVLTRGPWIELSEHQVVQGAVSIGGQWPRRSGELTCHRAQ